MANARKGPLTRTPPTPRTMTTRCGVIERSRLVLTMKVHWPHFFTDLGAS